MSKPSDIHESENAQQDRPSLPESYGVARAPEGMLSWAWVDEQMRRSRSYWIATTRPDGRPHVIPVWGVWFDDTFYFGTSTDSRKGRNLARNPALAVHLESGDDVVILEGVADVLTDPAGFERYADAYEAKYAVRPSNDPSSDGSPTRCGRAPCSPGWSATFSRRRRAGCLNATDLSTRR